MRLEVEHISQGCNRVRGCLAWSRSGLVAYGSHNCVVLYDWQAAKVLHVLLGHKARVNTVCWLDQGPGLPLIISGDAAGALHVWQIQTASHSEPWLLLWATQAHRGSITALAACQLAAGSSAVFSAAGDAQLRQWHSTSGQEWTEGPSISTGGVIPCSLSVLHLQQGRLLLAAGCADNAARLYLREPTGACTCVCKLRGHTDWITSVSLRSAGSRLLLATGSQDKHVRIWSIRTAAAAAAQPAANASGALSFARYAPQLRFAMEGEALVAELEALLVGHEDWVHSVAWNPAAVQPAPTASSPLDHSSTPATHHTDVAQPNASTDQQQSCGAAAQGPVGTTELQRSPAAEAAGADANGEHLQSSPEESSNGLRHKSGNGPAQSAAPNGSAPAKRPEPWLMSTSMDRTIMLWHPDPATGLWLSDESVGDAGASALGYNGGCWSCDGQAILAHGFTGALHLWQRSEQGAWRARHAQGGHHGAVVDLAWGVGGTCLLSVGTDQTARMHACHRGHWCEIARPQVHGHDFACAAMLPPDPQDPGRHTYISGSEEKVLRVMEAPQAFLDTWAAATGQAPAPPSFQGTRALGAAITALGLSNKAIMGQQQGPGAASHADGPDVAPHAAPSVSAGPPLEEHLAHNTLWPEVLKLYGHGNDLFCVAADPLGHFVASACKAQAPEPAAILLWTTSNWTVAASLPAHTLTVTQLEFSPDGARLLSVSRDRSIAVFERSGDPLFRLVQRIAKAHQRIVWACSWAPNSQRFATGSRDGAIRIWACQAAGTIALQQDLPNRMQPVRSLAFAPPAAAGEEELMLACGLEDGHIQLLKLGADGSTCTMAWASDRFSMHAAAVRRLCWCPAGPTGRLASCGEDHAVKVFRTAVAE